MSFWEENDLTPKVENILRQQKPSKQYAHFGRPFLTAIQLAHKFKRVYPEIIESFIEEEGVHQHALSSLAAFLVKELFGRISIGRITSIEGAVLSTSNLNKLNFVIDDVAIKSLIEKDSLDLFVFRYR